MDDEVNGDDNGGLVVDIVWNGPEPSYIIDVVKYMRYNHVLTAETATSLPMMP